MNRVKVLDPRINVVGDEDQVNIVFFGGSRINEQVFTADSSQLKPSAPVNALFTILPPSTLTIVDRNIRIKAFVEVVCNQPHQLKLNDALRQYPLNSIIDVTSCQVNGENLSENSGDKLHALHCYGSNLEEMSRVVSTSPTYPDQYQDYDDYVTEGTGKNCLGAFGENGVPCGARGGFVVEVVDANTFRAVVVESLQLSPFHNGLGYAEEGMVNVNQININLRFKSELSRILSHSAAGNAITSVSCTFYERPQCLVRFITPNMTQRIPEIQHLGFHSDQDYIKDIGTLAPGASGKRTTDVIKLGQIPESVYIFIRHSRDSSDFKTADSFLVIDRVNILFNNESGLLSGCGVEDLYEISARNGCNLSFPAWSNYRGSVLKLKFGQDIGLPDYLAPGCQTQASIQITIDYTNKSKNSFTGELYTVFRNTGTFSIFENGARASVGNLTPDIVRDAIDAPEMHFEDYKRLSGGSFWSKLKGIVNKIAHFVTRAVPVATKVASVVAPEALPIIQGLGQGANIVSGLTGGRMAGGRMSGGGVSGGGVSGGRIRRRLR